MGASGRRPSKTEAALWRRITDDVTPLKRREAPPAREETGEKTPAGTTKPKPAAKGKQAARPAPVRAAPAKPPQTELQHGVAAGVDKRTVENLRRGRLPIEAEIDLHGMTQAEAHRALVAFVTGHHAAGRRCVLVVTGRGATRDGGGVLRASVPGWLNAPALRPCVLAFSYARPKDGGDGALYVLLRRKR